MKSFPIRPPNAAERLRFLMRPGGSPTILKDGFEGSGYAPLAPYFYMRRERLKLRASSGRDEALHLEIRFVAPSLEAHLRLTPLRDIPVNP